MKLNKLGFTLGFSDGMCKTAIKKKILDYLSSTAGNYLKKRFLPVVGSAAGWTIGSNIFENISDGKEISPYKLSDDFIENVGMFGAWDVGTSLVGAGLGGVGKGIGALAKRLGYVASKTPSAAQAAATIRSSAAKMLSTPAGRRVAKVKIGIRKGIGKLTSAPAIGAAIGAYTSHDKDAPITSTAMGALKGGVLGKLLGGSSKRAPNPLKSPEPSFMGNVKSDARLAAGFGAMGNELEKKQKREQDRQIKEYYKRMNQRQSPRTTRQ